MQDLLCVLGCQSICSLPRCWKPKQLLTAEHCQVSHQRHGMKQGQTGPLTGIRCTGQSVPPTGQALQTAAAWHTRRPSHGQLPSIDWAPCSPVDGLSHYLLVGSHVMACRHADWSCDVPAPPAAELPLAIYWHAWCWDATQQLHLVFACKTESPCNRKLLNLHPLSHLSFIVVLHDKIPSILHKLAWDHT